MVDRAQTILISGSKEEGGATDIDLPNHADNNTPEEGVRTPLSQDVNAQSPPIYDKEDGARLAEQPSRATAPSEGEQVTHAQEP